MTPQDQEMLQKFWTALQQRCNLMGVPVRQAGIREERDNNGNVYLISCFFQVVMLQYELYVNTNVQGAERYGWRML